MSNEKLFLVDGYSFIFRAFHAMPNLTTPDGTPIGAITGFIKMMMRLLDGNNVTNIAVILDKVRNKDSHRHIIYPEYKAHRPPVPEELIVQFKIMREVLDALGIRYVEEQGIEADDLIASYTKYAVANGYQVRIVSSDKDLFQLLDNEAKVVLYDPVKEFCIGVEEVRKKLGVNPEQVADYLALVGDSADNIPGVKGIGPKNASTLLQSYHNIEQIYDNIDSIQPIRIKNLLASEKELAFTSKSLTVLVSNLNLNYNLEEFTWQGLGVHGNDIQQLFQKYALKGLANQYFNKIISQQLSKSKENNSNSTVVEQSIIIKKLECSIDNMLNEEEWKSFWNHVQNYGYLAIYANLKTSKKSSKNNSDNKSLLQSLSLLSSGFYLTIESPDLILTQVESLPYHYLNKLLSSKAIKKIVENYKQLCFMFTNCNITLNAIEDVITMCYSLGAGKYNQKYELTQLANDYLPYFFTEEYNQLEINLKNTLILDKLYPILLNKLYKQQQLSLYYNIDKPLNAILSNMEKKGVLIDKEFLMALREDYSKQIDRIANEIYAMSGEEINLASPKQLSEVLFKKLKLPISQSRKKDDSNHQYSTNSEVLYNLAEQGFVIANKILEWRQLFKITTTYITALLDSIDTDTRRVHTNFNPTFTNTARLSSSSPNLQSIPIRSNEGNRIRLAFIAEPGSVILSADYSQIELRLLAHIANIIPLREALKSGSDIHSLTASQVFNIPIEKVDNIWRRRAKAINFGIIYGISPFGLARNLRIELEEAKQYINNYFKQYPGIKQYMEDTIKYVKDHGYALTLFKRRCYIPDISSKNSTIFKIAERAAINAPLQGTAADIIRKAMVKLPQDVSRYLRLQIHDELLFEIPESEVNQLSSIIRHTMESVANLSVPLSVDLSVGRSWGELIKI